MTFGSVPRFLVIDDFLPPKLLAGLLEHALAHGESFHPTQVMRQGESQVVLDARISAQSDVGLGPHKAAFSDAVRARLDHFVAALGLRPFTVAWTELQLIAHGDTAFYKAHIDTHTQSSRTDQVSDRVISTAFYFYREPKRFSGGEIAIHPFDREGMPELVEPRQNRLVVFPSIAWHEVRAVSCPSGEFADSRFTINCWLHRDGPVSKPLNSAPAS